MSVTELAGAPYSRRGVLGFSTPIFLSAREHSATAGIGAR